MCHPALAELGPTAAAGTATCERVLRPHRRLDPPSHGSGPAMRHLAGSRMIRCNSASRQKPVGVLASSPGPMAGSRPGGRLPFSNRVIRGRCRGGRLRTLRCSAMFRSCGRLRSLPRRLLRQVLCRRLALAGSGVVEDLGVDLVGGERCQQCEPPDGPVCCSECVGGVVDPAAGQSWFLAAPPVQFGGHRAGAYRCR
jgi:hypothetical protein